MAVLKLILHDNIGKNLLKKKKCMFVITLIPIYLLVLVLAFSCLGIQYL